jgi:hypothetical protein
VGREETTHFEGVGQVSRRRRRTPQRKKELSLDRDTPLSAEYPKAFRKHWPKKKALAERRRRRHDRTALRKKGEEMVPARHAPPEKWKQAPLREVIARKLARRAAVREQPRKSAAARERRRKRRGKRVR